MTTRAAAAVLLGLSFLAFVALGLPDGVLGVAWPAIRGELGLPLDALGALLVAATVGYVASSFASGWLLARMSVGSLLAASCALAAASLLGYSAAPGWGAMIACGLVAGLGAGAIDAGINTHVAAHHTARTLSLLHACYGLGAAVGPILMTGVLLAGSTWRLGYAILGTAQIALAVCFQATRALWPRHLARVESDADAMAIGLAATRRSTADDATPAPIRATLRLRAARLGIVSFFLYVGVEAAAGAWIYSLLYESRGFSMGAAGAAVSVYWSGLFAGRLLFGVVPESLHPRALPRAASLGVAAAAGLLALSQTGPLPMLAAVGALGAACGPIFPSLIASTPRRLGAAHAANGVGFQIAAAALGQSLLPALFGVVAGSSSLEVVPLALVAAAIVLAAVLGALERTGDAAPPAPGLSAEDRERQVGRHDPVRRVDDLADLEVHRGSAQAVGLLRR